MTGVQILRPCRFAFGAQNNSKDSDAEFDDVAVLEDEITADGLTIEVGAAPNEGGFEIVVEIFVDFASEIGHGAATFEDEGAAEIGVIPGGFGIDADDV